MLNRPVSPPDLTLDHVHTTTTYNQSFTALYIYLFGGNDNIQLAGNDTVQVGSGNNVVVTDNGNNNIQAGNGDNLIVDGLGHDNIQAGNGNKILIDGTVSLPIDTLLQVLRDRIDYGKTKPGADFSYIDSALLGSVAQ